MPTCDFWCKGKEIEGDEWAYNRGKAVCKDCLKQGIRLLNSPRQEELFAKWRRLKGEDLIKVVKDKPKKPNYRYRGSY